MPAPDTPSLLVVAGEASGDLHAARLLSHLRRLVGPVDAWGLGGDEMVAEGFETVADVGEISVVGLAEVLRVWSRARRIFDDILAAVERRRPRLAVLVDFPEFNLRLAPELERRGVPVIYYISPQLWAWRRGRVKTIARSVDTMLVLFPFEAEFYRDHGVEAIHVGHPLVDEVPELPHVWDRAPSPLEAGEPFQIALLPGSRTSEVERLLPPMLETVALLAREIPVYARVVRAPTIPIERIEEHVAASGVPAHVTTRNRFEALADSHFALCASGTATLETGLLGTPLAVLYRLGTWTYLMAKLLVRLPHVSLVNLVLERRAVPELLQGDSRPEVVAREVLAVLRDPQAIAAMRRDLGELRQRLGESGASRRAAREVARRLGGEMVTEGNGGVREAGEDGMLRAEASDGASDEADEAPAPPPTPSGSEDPPA